jgi:hypothetical protein
MSGGPLSFVLLEGRMSCRMEDALKDLKDLEDPDRNRRLHAVFRLGEVYAGQAAEGGGAARPEVQRVVEALEAMIADKEEGSWVRKRARRALKKLRGEA